MSSPETRRSMNGYPLTIASLIDTASPLRALLRAVKAQLLRGVARIDRRGLLAFGLPLIIYRLTLAPTIYNLDSAELTTAAYTGGLMRATGYPLYLMIGRLWSRLPIGDVGFRMNLFSAVCGALTILLADRILRRWQVGGWAAFGALGLLATATFFWGLSLVAEVYTLHTALMAALILALLRWSDQPTPARLGLVGLIGGLGMTHHAAMVLLVPGSIFFVLVTHPRRVFQPAALAAAAVGTLLGLSVYLYLPLRYLAQPAFNYAGTYDAALQFHPVDLTTLSGLWWLISGRAFAGMMLAYNGAELWHETRLFLAQLGQAFFVIGIGPGILGFLVLARRNWRETAMLAVMFALSAGFYINYRVLDKDTMYLPAYLVFALWVGIGYQELLAWVRGSAGMALQGAILGSILIALVWNWGIVDLSQDWSARQRGEAILTRAEPGGLVFGWWDTVPVVQYLQLVEGKKPDIKAINRFLLAPQDLVYVIEKEVHNRPVYIDSSPNGLSVKLVAKPVGAVYRIVARNSPRTMRQDTTLPPSHRR